MNTPVNAEIFKVGGWLVDPAGNRIQRGESSVNIQPRAMDVLVYLARHPGKVVTRAELEEHVWRDMVVGYDALTNTIIKLRKAFGDDSHDSKIIETIPKKGYRLIASVADVPASETQTLAQDTGKSADQRHSMFRIKSGLGVTALVLFTVIWLWFSSFQHNESDQVQITGGQPSEDSSLRQPAIAVLPFTDLSDDLDQGYFVDGMTEDLITDLSRLPGLSVVARNSAFSYKGKNIRAERIADELGVQYILRGSIRRTGDQLRVNIQLVETLTETHLWAERFDVAFTDVFTVQDRITAKIIMAMKLNLNVPEKFNSTPLDIRAYDAFLQGWAFYQGQTPQAFANAYRYYQRALEFDPEYNRVNAALAALFWEIHLREWYPTLGMDWLKVKQMAFEYRDRALQDPSPLALVVAADMSIWRRQHEEAIAQVRQAITLSPNNAYANLELAKILVYAGKPYEALEYITTANRLDPFGEPKQLLIRGLAEFGLEQYEQAAVTLQQALALNPDYSKPRAILAAALGHLGETDALSIIEPYETEKWTFSTQSAVLAFPYYEPEDRNRLAEGLQKAGMKTGW